MLDELFLESTNVEASINTLINKAKSGKITKKDIDQFNMETKEVDMTDPAEAKRVSKKIIITTINCISTLLPIKIFIPLHFFLFRYLQKLADRGHASEAIQINNDCIKMVKQELEKKDLNEKQIKQLNKVLKKLEKANKRITKAGLRINGSKGKVFQESNILDLYGIFLENETDPEVIGYVLGEGIKDLFKCKKKKVQKDGDKEEAQEELTEEIKTLLSDVVEYNDIDTMCEDVTNLLAESISMNDEELFNEGIKNLIRKKSAEYKEKKAQKAEDKARKNREQWDLSDSEDDEIYEAKKEKLENSYKKGKQRSAELRERSIAKTDARAQKARTKANAAKAKLSDNETISESIEFEEFDPIVLTEDEVRLVMRGDKYLISESDFESVCFNYLGEKNGYEVLNTIAESHDIDVNDLYIMMSEGQVANSKVNVNKAMAKK